MPVKVTQKQVTRSAGKVIINNRDLANALVQDNRTAVKLLGVKASAIQISRDGRVVVTDKTFATKIREKFAAGGANGICGLRC